MKRRTVFGVGFLVTAATLLPLLRAAEAAPPPPDLSGTWEGQVLFVNGHRGRAQLELTRTDPPGTYAGTYTLTLIGEEGDETPRTSSAHVVLVGDEVRITAEGEVQRGLVGTAGSHAELSLRGTFSATPDRAGVFLLWRYRR